MSASKIKTFKFNYGTSTDRNYEGVVQAASEEQAIELIESGDVPMTLVREECEWAEVNEITEVA